jgi:hypothetical protein
MNTARWFLLVIIVFVGRQTATAENVATISGAKVSSEFWPALVQHYGNRTDPIEVIVAFQLMNGQIRGVNMYKSSGVKIVDQAVCDWISSSWHPQTSVNGSYVLRLSIDIAHHKVAPMKV